AEVGELDDPVALLVQGDAVEGDGHAVALHGRMVSHPAPRILTPGHVRSPGPGPGSPGYPASSSLPSRAARSEASVVPGGTSRRSVDGLAVASRVPSSAHRWTTPWPKPLATAWMRMSSSTHSVGTSR